MCENRVKDIKRFYQSKLYKILFFFFIAWSDFKVFWSWEIRVHMAVLMNVYFWGLEPHIFERVWSLVKLRQHLKFQWSIVAEHCLSYLFWWRAGLKWLQYLW